MMDPLPHIVGALDLPLDSLKREVQQSMRQLAVMAGQLEKLTGQVEDHAARLKGFDDTIQNMQQRHNFR